MTAIQWFKGTNLGRYWVSDVTDATKKTGPLPVAATVGVTASDLGKAEDAPHVSGDTGVFVLGVNNRSNATFNTTQGDYTPFGVDDYGALRAMVSSTVGTIANVETQSNDSLDSGSRNALSVLGYNLLYDDNNTDWQRQRGNSDYTLLASAARTITTNSPDQANYNARGLKLVFNMSNVGTGSVTVKIQGKDSISGTYYDLLTGAAVITNVLNVYTMYPGMTAVANVSSNDILPRVWRIVATANNANSATYSVSASVIL